MREADILWDVVEEHLDEAAFLWTHWERALVAPNMTLQEVIRGPEERLLAHIDGLLVAGEPAVARLCIPALEGEEADKVFVAAITLLEGVTNDAFERVLARIDDADPDVWYAISRALALACRQGIETELLCATRSERSPRIAVALSALATRRVEVPENGILLASPEPVVLEQALRAARTGDRRQAALVEGALGSEVAAVRDAAIETGLVLGLRGALQTSRRIVDEERSDAAFPLIVLAIAGGDDDFQRILAALDSEQLRAAALVALGYTGRPAAVDACMPFLADEKIARLAGEVVTAIAGLEIEGPYRRNEQEPEQPPRIEDDDLDADLVPGPEAMLPVPEPAAVEKWWSDARACHDAKRRYVSGAPWSAELQVHAFEHGTMRRRHVLGLGIEALEGGRGHEPRASVPGTVRKTAWSQTLLSSCLKPRGR